MFERHTFVELNFLLLASEDSVERILLLDINAKECFVMSDVHISCLFPIQRYSFAPLSSRTHNDHLFVVISPRYPIDLPREHSFILDPITAFPLVVLDYFKRALVVSERNHLPIMGVLGTSHDVLNLEIVDLRELRIFKVLYHQVFLAPENQRRMVLRVDVPVQRFGPYCCGVRGVNSE